MAMNDASVSRLLPWVLGMLLLVGCDTRTGEPASEPLTLGLSLQPSSALIIVALEQSLLLLLEDQARWANEEGLAVGPVPDYLELIHLGGLLELAPHRVSVIR